MENRLYPRDRGRVYVLCTDTRFARAIALEMDRLGLTAETMAADAFSPRGDVFPLLVLADGDSPVAEGWETLRQRADCPWIFWSRQDMPPVEGVPCLHRPFDLETLARTVRACLTGREVSLPAAFVAESAPPTSLPQKAPVPSTVREGVLLVGGEEVALTPYEWAVYTCLAEHRGSAVPRETLRACLDGSGGNTVDVYVCHLRAKLEKPLGVRLITTVRGQGYRMD